MNWRDLFKKVVEHISKHPGIYALGAVVVATGGFAGGVSAVGAAAVSKTVFRGMLSNGAVQGLATAAGLAAAAGAISEGIIIRHEMKMKKADLSQADLSKNTVDAENASERGNIQSADAVMAAMVEALKVEVKTLTTDLSALRKKQADDNGARVTVEEELVDLVSKLSSKQSTDNAARETETTNLATGVSALTTKQAEDNGARVNEEAALKSDIATLSRKQDESQSTLLIMLTRMETTLNTLAAAPQDGMPTLSRNHVREPIYYAALERLNCNQGDMSCFKEDLNLCLDSISHESVTDKSEVLIKILTVIFDKKLDPRNFISECLKMIQLIRAMFDANDKDSRDLAAKCSFTMGYVIKPWNIDNKPFIQQWLPVFSLQLHYHQKHEPNLFYYAFVRMLESRNSLENFIKLNLSEDIYDEPLTWAAIDETSNEGVIAHLNNSSIGSEKTQFVMKLLAHEFEAVKAENPETADEVHACAAREILNAAYYRQNNLTHSSIVEHLAIEIPESLLNDNFVLISLITDGTLAKLKSVEPINNRSNGEQTTLAEQLKQIKLRKAKTNDRQATPSQTGAFAFFMNSEKFKAIIEANQSNEAAEPAEAASADWA